MTLQFNYCFKIKYWYWNWKANNPKHNTKSNYYNKLNTKTQYATIYSTEKNIPASHQNLTRKAQISCRKQRHCLNQTAQNQNTSKTLSDKKITRIPTPFVSVTGLYLLCISFISLFYLLW